MLFRVYISATKYQLPSLALLRSVFKVMKLGRLEILQEYLFNCYIPGSLVSSHGRLWVLVDRRSRSSFTKKNSRYIPFPPLICVCDISMEDNISVQICILEKISKIQVLVVSPVSFGISFICIIPEVFFVVRGTISIL